MHVGKRGDEAYYDSYAGLIPCTVVDIRNYGRELIVQLTASRGAFQQGQYVTASYPFVYPAAATTRLGGRVTVRPYCWEGAESGGAQSVDTVVTNDNGHTARYAGRGGDT